MPKSKSVEPGPRLRSPEEIDMNLVRQARELREQQQEVPIGSRAAIELVRYLRSTGELDGRSYREDYPPHDGTESQSIFSEEPTSPEVQ